MTKVISAPLILSRTAELMRQGAARWIPTVVVLSGLGALVDSGLVDQANASAINLVTSGVSIAANYWITKSLLQEARGRGLPARFPAFLGLGLISTTAILLGLVVLIIPGIVLAVRWSVSAPILLDTEDSVSDALRSSWRATKSYFWPILLAWFSIYGLFLALGMTAYLAGTGLSGRTLGLALSALAVDTGLIAGWHVAVATYALIEAPKRVAETFT